MNESHHVGGRIFLLGSVIAFALRPVGPMRKGGNGGTTPPASCGTPILRWAPLMPSKAN
jgi:hypothetical protein